ncbi:unnamed protein product [Periconia digitata]|uniref:Uncharacterized protein n=1 Tax=Periconia digitata TaxID=1303443 RepID=A0A9W4UG29_9PLEO|nr:unnamed protein product [Periconia digitata]
MPAVPSPKQTSGESISKLPPELSISRGPPSHRAWVHIRLSSPPRREFFFSSTSLVADERRQWPPLRSIYQSLNHAKRVRKNATAEFF